MGPAHLSLCFPLLPTDKIGWIYLLFTRECKKIYVHVLSHDHKSFLYILTAIAYSQSGNERSATMRQHSVNQGIWEQRTCPRNSRGSPNARGRRGVQRERMHGDSQDGASSFHRELLQVSEVASGSGGLSGGLTPSLRPALSLSQHRHGSLPHKCPVITEMAWSALRNRQLAPLVT